MKTICAREDCRFELAADRASCPPTPPPEPVPEGRCQRVCYTKNNEGETDKVNVGTHPMMSAVVAFFIWRFCSRFSAFNIIFSLRPLRLTFRYLRQKRSSLAPTQTHKALPPKTLPVQQQKQQTQQKILFCKTQSGVRLAMCETRPDEPVTYIRMTPMPSSANTDSALGLFASV